MDKRIRDSNGNVFVEAGRVSGDIRFSGGSVHINADADDTGKSSGGHMTNVISGNGNVVVEADSIYGDITFG